MEFAQPVERTRQEEVCHLPAPIIINERVPIGVNALTRVGMLVERRPVEPTETMGVVWEVSGHPVEDQAEPRDVTGLDESAEVVGRAVPAGRRKQRDWLVSPGSVEWVLRRRQNLDMGKAHILDVGDELASELAIRQVPSMFGEIAPPRAEMDFVDRDRRLAIITAPELGHPRAVVPDMPRRVGND